MELFRLDELELLDELLPPVLLELLDELELPDVEVRADVVVDELEEREELEERDELELPPPETLVPPWTEQRPVSAETR